jgi:hypothetical protein
VFFKSDSYMLRSAGLDALVGCGALQRSAVQCSAVRCKAVQCARNSGGTTLTVLQPGWRGTPCMCMCMCVHLARAPPSAGLRRHARPSCHRLVRRTATPRRQQVLQKVHALSFQICLPIAMVSCCISE